MARRNISKSLLFVCYVLFVALIGLYIICILSGIAQATIIALSGNIVPLLWLIGLGMSTIILGKLYYDHG
jgi:hypothetical protein